MTTAYVLKPPTVSAMQFTGGATSANEIGYWLSSYGSVVTYDADHDDLIVRTSTDPSTIPLIADATDWVVMDATLALSIVLDSEFSVMYQTAAEAEVLISPVAEPAPVLDSEPHPDHTLPGDLPADPEE